MATTTTSGETATDEALAGVVARRGQPGGSMASAGSAFDGLYRRHAPLLLARVARSDADDLHQVVWLRVWEFLPEADPGPFRGWLYKIAHNAVIDHARKKRPGPLGPDGDLADARVAGPDLGLIESERTAALEACLAKLPPEAAALVRARLDGRDYSEIAKALGMVADQAYRRFHKAKAQLQTCVERALS